MNFHNFTRISIFGLFFHPSSVFAYLFPKLLPSFLHFCHFTQFSLFFFIFQNYIIFVIFTIFPPLFPPFSYFPTILLDFSTLFHTLLHTLSIMSLTFLPFSLLFNNFSSYLAVFTHRQQHVTFTRNSSNLV